ncbi:MAG: 6-phosphogluconolactonase, partial [Phycisphaerales bacterium]
MDAHGADDEIRVEGLDPPVETPRLRGKVIARASVHELLDELSSDLTAHALNCVREFGDFHLALSGGQTPMPLYEQLMYDPRYRAIPWRRTHLWMVDERCVGFEDERSNFGRIKEVIVDHSDIPPEQVHPMIAMAPGAGERYERELREALG